MGYKRVNNVVLFECTPIIDDDNILSFECGLGYDRDKDDIFKGKSKDFEDVSKIHFNFGSEGVWILPDSIISKANMNCTYGKLGTHTLDCKISK